MITRKSFVDDATETIINDIDSALDLGIEEWKNKEGFIDLEIGIHSVYLSERLREFITSVLVEKYQFKSEEIADITESDDEESIIVTLNLRGLM